jgi:hypothetical protein
MTRSAHAIFAVTLVSLWLPTAALAGAVASSELQDSWGESGASASNSAVDGSLETAWIEGNENDGVGEWIELDLPRGTLKSFTVSVGKGPDDVQFKRYARPKQIDIDIFSLDDAQNPIQVTQITHAFDDTWAAVTIEAGDQLIGGDLWGGKARFTIRSVYTGTDFDTLVAISEIRANFKVDPCPTMVVEMSSNPGDKGKLTDESPKSVWIAAGGAEEWVTVESPDWSISRIGIFPGHGSSSSNFAAYSRPKTVDIRVMMETFTVTLEDKRELQWFDLPVTGGYNGSSWGEVRVQVRDVYAGGSHAEVAISDIILAAINYGG